MVVLLGVSGCGTDVGPVASPPDTVIASNPVLIAAAAAGLSAVPHSATANEEVVFVSLAPGTVSDGQLATVRRLGSTNTVSASIVAGGLDPVPVIASAGDSVEIAVTAAGSSLPVIFKMVVPSRRRPVVVRADPPPRKRDVPLNTAIVIVFDEPVASSSLASGVQLFHGSTAVSGTVELLGGTATAAVFQPSGNLEPNTDYRLVVTRDVRDLTGDALAANATVEFTTGTTTVGQAYSVSVVPDTTALSIGSQVQLLAVARDSSGEPISGRPVLWSSDNPGVATVSASGLVTALAQGEAHVRAEVDGRTGVAVILGASALAPAASLELRPESATVVIGGFVQLSAVLRDAAGNILPFRPVTWETSAPGVVGVSGGSGGKAVVTGVAAGRATVAATSEGKRATATITVGTVGPFAQISANEWIPTGWCALTTDGAAWCWGGNGAGELGNGTMLLSSVPTAVAGGLRFSGISGTCALTAEGAAYCWGTNWWGALGVGTAIGPEVCPSHGQCSTTPVAVAGGLRFSTMDRGVLVSFTCALAQSGDAYCWGDNGGYELGLGTRTGPEYCPDGALLTGSFSCSTAPAKVTGGFTFTAVSAGRLHACALTTSGAAYCWGTNYAGQLGDGTTSDRTSPVPVVGGHVFASIAAGYEHTCALTSDGNAYCWGSGPLGGAASSSMMPVLVADTLRFASVSAGVHHNCALTRAGAAYCWGANYAGQLGNGTFDGAATPVAVAGGHVFASLDTGSEASCGLTVAGVAYCWGGYVSNVPVKVPGQP